MKNNNIAFPAVVHCTQNKRALCMYVCDEWIICDNINYFPALPSVAADTQWLPPYRVNLNKRAVGATQAAL